jgi:hypothetical protein
VLDVTTTSTDPAARYDLPSLDQLMHRPTWMADAACREHPELSWYPERGEDVRAQKAICACCLVRDECAEAGVRERHGIWAGESARNRKLIRSSGHRDAA